jgi:transglutaminase/protease-like cytokinesis protein 3
MDYSYILPIKDYIGILRVENRVSEIKEATKNMSDKKKIIYVYDWMGKNNYYDKVFMHDSKNQSIYNVFVRGNAVCAGFAKASQIIFSQIGIESYIIEGHSTGPHMWNVVKYKGKYYFFDSTVAVSINEGYKDYHYEGLNQAYLNSYTILNPDWYPEIERENMFKINKEDKA